MRREELEAAGIDVEDALARVLGNEALLEQLLQIYARDASVTDLARAVEADDVEGARAAAHALKGVAANLSMTALSDLAARMLELLHAGDLAGARGLMEQVRAAHGRVLAAIAADAGAGGARAGGQTAPGA